MRPRVLREKTVTHKQKHLPQGILSFPELRPEGNLSGSWGRVCWGWREIGAGQVVPCLELCLEPADLTPLQLLDKAYGAQRWNMGSRDQWARMRSHGSVPRTRAKDRQWALILAGTLLWVMLLDTFLTSLTSTFLNGDERDFKQEYHFTQHFYVTTNIPMLWDNNKSTPFKNIIFKTQ